MTDTAVTVVALIISIGLTVTWVTYGLAKRSVRKQSRRRATIRYAVAYYSAKTTAWLCVLIFYLDILARKWWWVVPDAVVGLLLYFDAAPYLARRFKEYRRTWS